MASRPKSGRTRRIRQTVAARDALGGLARALTFGPGRSELGLALAWAQVTDARLRQHVHPLRIERNKLVLRARGPQWAAEVRRNEATILARLTETLGEGRIEALSIEID